MDFTSVLTHMRRTLKIPYEFRDKQFEAFRKITVQDKVGLFLVLPTNYGKSDIFAYTPTLLDMMYPTRKSHFCVVVYPLKRLLQDQRRRWCRTGLAVIALSAATDLTPEMKEDIAEKKVQLILTYPELVVAQPLLGLLRKRCKHYSLALFAYDEVHCMLTWGQTFRPEYQKMDRLRTIFPSTPVLLLSATCTQHMVTEIASHLGLSPEDYDVIAEISNRPNIYLEISPEKNITEGLGWVTRLILAEGANMPKIIIFARSIDICSNIYGELYDAIKDAILVDTQDDSDRRIVDMYHGNLHETDAKRISVLFSHPDCNLRVLITTIAFAMGMQVPDVQYVLHWGPSENLLMYWQEVGRAGRDGRQCKAILYLPAYSLNKKYVQSCMFNYIENKTECLRKSICKYLMLQGMQEKDINKLCGGERCCSAPMEH